MDRTLRSGVCEEIEAVFFLIHKVQNRTFVYTLQNFPYTTENGVLGEGLWRV
jgi:hypothetical protein